MSSTSSSPTTPAPVRFLDLVAQHAPLRAELDDAWHRAVDTAGFIGGAAVDTFEAEWAEYCGRTHAIGVANGTDSLGLIMQGLGLGPGDEVIVPANTFVASVEAITSVGATPVFADVDPATLLITADEITARCGPKTAAVLVVSLYGQVPDMDAIEAATSAAGIALIEDAAQAHGATWNGRRAGSFGVAGSFSFYPGKNLGAFGDGGAVTTDDDQLAATIRSLANHGRSLDGHLDHPLDGRNSRLDALQASILSIKLRHLDEWNAARAKANALYRAELADSGATLVDIAEQAIAVHHLEVIRVDDRDALRDALAREQIGTGVHYAVPCHQQPAFAHFATDAYPVAEHACAHQLSLPMHPMLTDDEVLRVSAAVRRALG